MSSSTTLNDLFPGNSGRMIMVRVILRKQMPELSEMDRDKPLSPDLVATLKQAIEEVQAG